jgi:uncharacterized short protein YbdD (DUF466 family)
VLVTRLSAVTHELLAWPARAWHWVRALSGDDAYERYLEHCRVHHYGCTPLDRRQFYVREQERRYSGGPTSCC